MLDNTLINTLKTREHLLTYLKQHSNKHAAYKEILEKYNYEQELLRLQAELVDFQKWTQNQSKKIAIIFEGRDASGKGGSIKRFKEHLNPRAMRVVALNKPTNVERHQWYFNRYIKELPNKGEIVFFDRSWYNRAVVEPVMGFCNKNEYKQFMLQVPEFEYMLNEANTTIIKFWFSVSKKEQQKRFNRRLQNPLKKWKYSPVDAKGQELWDEFTHYKNNMFAKTHTTFCPWVIVKADNKLSARLESIKYVLSLFNYDGKGNNCKNLNYNTQIVQLYSNDLNHLDK